MPSNIRISGNIGKAPEVKPTSKGQMGMFSVAVWAGWEDKEAKTSRTQWFQVVCFDADLVHGFAKGDKVTVEGNLRLDKWTDRDNNERETLKVIADSVEYQDGGRPEVEEEVF